MSYCYWNCASGFIRKWDTIKELLSNEQPDVFFVAEADLANGFDLSMLHVQGYAIDLNSTYHIRGKCRLITFHKEQFKRVLSLEENGNELIVLSNNTQVVVGVYRHFKCFDSETVTSNFERLMTNLSSIVRHFSSNATFPILILGDMNVDLSGDELTPSPFYKKLNGWLDNFVLDQLVTEYTRMRLAAGILQVSLLDLCITNFPGFVVRLEFNNYSDHNILRCNNKVVRSSSFKETVTYYDYYNNLGKDSKSFWDVINNLTTT